MEYNRIYNQHLHQQQIGYENIDDENDGAYGSKNESQNSNDNLLNDATLQHRWKFM